MNDSVLEHDSRLYSADLAPTGASERTWGMWNIAALWVGMAVCIPTYQLASGMVSQGLLWWQAILIVMLGNVIVLLPMVLNARAGTAFGIPFPVLARASFGVLGANVPAILRSLVACGWFGIQTWIGGMAIYQLVAVLWGFAPNVEPDPTTGQFACFLLFWAINVVFIWRGTESIKWLETVAAPVLLGSGLLLFAWAFAKVGSFSDMVSGLTATRGDRSLWSLFWPNLTAMVGFWATLSLNIPDFTRYVRSQREQTLGQMIGLPTTMTLFAFIGVTVTSATAVIFGAPIWDPVVLVSKIGSVGVVGISMVLLTIVTLSTNIAANVVSPANGFANALPSRISFKLGGYITAGIGIAIFPWKLLASASAYVFTWLIGYSALLGPICGILIADYFVLRRQRLRVNDLYRRGGIYEYWGGINWIAIGAMLCGVAPSLPGFVMQLQNIGAQSSSAAVPSLWQSLYHYAWFLGFAVSALLYLVLMVALPLGATGQHRSIDMKKDRRASKSEDEHRPKRAPRRCETETRDCFRAGPN